MLEMHRQKVAIWLTLMALLTSAITIFTNGSSASADANSDLTDAQRLLRQCQLDLQFATTSGERTRALQCITIKQKVITGLTATPSPSPTPTVTNSPSPSPSPTVTTPPPTTTTSSPPPVSSFPDATNTGVPAGVVLKTSVPSCVSVSSSTYWIIGTGHDGCVIDSQLVPGQLEVRSNNVTIQNSRIMCSSDNCINQVSGSGLTVSHVEIGPNSGFANVNGARGINGNNGLTVVAVNIHNIVDGIWPGSDTTIQDSYIHDLDITNDGAHSDGIQSSGGTSNVTVRHNTIFGGNTSDLLVQRIDGLDNNWIIDNNQLFGVRKPDGVTSYAVGFDALACPNNDCRFINNVLNNVWEVGPSYTPTNWTSASWFNNVYTTGEIVPVPV